MSYYVVCSRMDHAVCGRWEWAQWMAERIDRENLCPHGPHYVDYKL